MESESIISREKVCREIRDRKQREKVIQKQRVSVDRKQ